MRRILTFLLVALVIAVMAVGAVNMANAPPDTAGANGDVGSTADVGVVFTPTAPALTHYLTVIVAIVAVTLVAFSRRCRDWILLKMPLKYSGNYSSVDGFYTWRGWSLPQIKPLY